MSKFRRILISCLFLLAVCLPVSSQSSDATLSGTVVDPQDKALPGVRVTISDPATGIERTVTTNGSGSFTLPSLRPSTYTLLVEAQGFKRTQVPNIVLNVGDQKAIQVQLSIGDVTSTVEVVADASTVRTDGSVGTVVDRSQVENMPLNGRSFQSLIALTPGVVFPTVSSDPVGGGQFSVNGQRTSANYFTVDGVSANYGITTSSGGFVGQSGSGALPAMSALGGTNTLVSVDALQEFKIQTSSYAPEFGRTPGGQIQMLTRSGTNSYHGTVFDYIRNEALDANDWFSNRSGLPRAQNRQHDFGGTLGGPLPFLNFGDGVPAFDSGKDRMFFFISYEGLRLRQPNTAISTVPNMSARQSAPTVLRPFYDGYPLPNRPTVSDGLAEFIASFSDPSTIDTYLLRIDRAIGKKVTIFGTYKNAHSETRNRSTTGPANQIAVRHFSDTAFTLGSTWVPSSSVSNEIRLNWSQAGGKTSVVLDDFGGAVVPSDQLLFGQWGNSRETSTTVVSFRNLSNVSASAYATGSGQDNRQHQFNLVDTISWRLGNHQLRAGFDIRRLTPDLSRDTFVSTQFFIQTQPVLRTLAFSKGESVPNKVLYENFSAFGQDAWQVNRRTLITYGLRWDYNTTPRSLNGQPPSVLVGLGGSAPATFAPAGTPLYQTELMNIAPRLGISYLLSQKSGREAVVRGGVGKFYDLGTGQLASQFGGIFPYWASRNYTNVPYPVNLAQYPRPVLGVDPPGSLILADPVIKLPYTIQWNAALEQSLGARQTITLSYVAASGQRLLRTIAGLRTLVAGFGSTAIPYNLTINDGYSDYRALQIQFQRRLSNRIKGLLAYTFGRSNDTSSSELTTSSGIGNRTISAADSYAFSDFDVRHTLSGSVTYNLPSVEGHHLVRAIANGWSMDGLYRFRTALPTTLTANNLISGLSTSNRPNVVPGVEQILFGPQYPGGKAVNPAAFTNPPNDTVGNFQRNSLRFFNASQLDMGLRRQFGFAEQVNVLVRIEFFNILNQANFSGPTGFAGGNNVSRNMLARGLGGLSPLYQMGGPRSGQVSVRLSF